MRASLLLALAPLASADSWWVIVAGSNGYQNYRHQADSCHVYQAARAHGIPEENIVLMMFDDVANNDGNPMMGKLYNTVDGQDVYKGCNIDYTGMDVSMENFFKVLNGDGSTKKKVLNSTADDKVFVVYTDHGAPGYVTFPSGPAMHAEDLNKALNDMNGNNMYKELLLYMDACNSGSMFDGILTAPNVFAVSAANGEEESYATYCPPYDKVQAENNREVFSCLGDIFTINWVLDSLAADTATETIGAQIDAVANKTLNMHDPPSHVQQFGLTGVRDETLSEYQGSSSNVTARAAAPHKGGAVSTRDVMLHLAKAKVERSPEGPAREQAQKELESVVAARAVADAQYGAIAVAAVGSDKAPAFLDGPVAPIPDATCYKASLAVAAEACGAMDEYSMRYSRLLANLCQGGLGEDAIARAVREGCK